MMNMEDCYYLGHFCLLECIGSGGYADVYHAIDLYLRRDVAIKVLRARINPRNAEAVNVHSLEARTLASLRHPHIIGVIEFNIENTIPYIVMEYAKNGSLRDIHPFGEQLEWDIILNYLEQITEALTFIHLHNIVHQDIKLENILMNENYEILVSDFGTIALIQQTDLYTSTRFVGTIQYAAPERFVHAAPTPASDIYSLAIVVYELFTGEHLFTGTREEVIYQHRFVKPSTRRMSALGISRSIQSVLLKALSKDPKKRYQNASDFFNALRLAVQKADNQQARQTMLAVVLISLLVASLFALLLHSIPTLGVALPILLILNTVVSYFKRE